MASGFVTSAGKQWAGMYDCGNTSNGSYAKPTKAGGSKTTSSKGGKK